MSAEGFALNAGTITAISVIVSSVTAAVVRITSVKGKYRAQAADVLVDAALQQRRRANAAQSVNSDLRAALQSIVNAIDYGVTNGGLSPNSLVKLHKSVDAARKVLRHEDPSAVDPVEDDAD